MVKWAIKQIWEWLFFAFKPLPWWESGWQVVLTVASLVGISSPQIVGKEWTDATRTIIVLSLVVVLFVWAAVRLWWRSHPSFRLELSQPRARVVLDETGHIIRLKVHNKGRKLDLRSVLLETNDPQWDNIVEMGWENSDQSVVSLGHDESWNLNIGYLKVENDDWTLAPKGPDNMSHRPIAPTNDVVALTFELRDNNTDSQRRRTPVVVEVRRDVLGSIEASVLGGD